MYRRSFAAAAAAGFTTLVPICSAIALAPSNTPIATRSDAGAVYTSCNQPNDVALTFDDGPARYHMDVSDTLSNASIKGTFFVNGDNFDCIYDVHQVSSLRKSFRAGHQIAAHTWSHPNLTTLNRDQIHGEFSKINTALQKILGIVPAVMRPPFGSYNDDVLHVASKLGQRVALWSFDSMDANGATPDASKQAYTDLANRHPITITSLQHETIESTPRIVLPFAIKTLKDKGYNFVTISECFGIPAYQSFQRPAARDNSWTC